MNLENLKNISEYIESENPKEKEERLFEKIGQISLIYADKKFQEIKRGGVGYKFSEAVKNFTPIENIILRPVFHLKGFKFSEYKEKVDLFFKDFYKEIDSQYEMEGFDLGKISDLVNSKKDLIKKYLEVEDLKELEHGKKKGGAKVMDFNQITNIEMNNRGKYKDLEKCGFSKLDQFVEVHVDNFYNTGEKNISSELIKNDFAVVAGHIIDKQPETAAVIGESWLLNTPIANRLGFKKIEDDAAEQNNFSTWLQFIDKNGQINQKRFNEFVKTGELPFKSIKAYIPTEEFLKRYLPDNRKGKIILKKLNKDREDFWFKTQKESQSIKTGWGDLLKNNDDFEDIIKNNKALNELLDFVDPDNKNKYLDFLKEMYDKKIPWPEFLKHESEDIKRINKKMRESMKNDLFKDKEVIIE